MQSSLRSVSLVVAAAVLAAVAQAQEPLPLWSIGALDDSTAEHAHAPAGYREYQRPGCYVVGASDPRRDWPYVQPGPVDAAWAPGTPQRFRVLFGLQQPPDGACRLLLDFVDTHSIDPPLLSVSVNDATWEFQTLPGAGDASVFGDPAAGREHVISIDVPGAALTAGNNEVSVTTVRGSWVLWDGLRFDAPPGTALAALRPHTTLERSDGEARQALLRRPGGPAQPLSLTVLHLGADTEATLQIGSGPPETVALRPGANRIQAFTAPVLEQQTVDVVLRQAGAELARGALELRPVRPMEIHLIHQTHLDIGYTHTQDEVLRRQVEYLHQALRYIEETRDYPEGARFVWHPEGMWAVDEFMRSASAQERARLLEACRRRAIHLDALYAQAMTGMYTEEELFELMGAAKRFEADHGVPIDSAMQSDVPGYTWGLAAALAHHGVGYMSIGPNHFHRMGYTFDWGDKPFWWVAPSGEHRVLFWMCGDGYAYFHSRALDEESVFAYLAGLERKGYPYAMTLMRYCIGGDNGPPNRALSDFVRDWNEEYVTPRLIIARNSEALQEFARRYGDELPVVRGDFTPYWEDGSASTALATGVNRRSCERIAQVQKLWAMLAPGLRLHDEFDRAWTKMVMYDEHTWGAHNSISHPDDDFAVQQDRYKQQFAFDGAALTQGLLERVTGATRGGSPSAVDVYNTASWPRDGLVVLAPEQSRAGDRVREWEGELVPSQRLASGDLAFRARAVPPLGSRRYTVEAGQARSTGRAHAAGLELTNGRVSLRIDGETGAIRSLRFASLERELVDQGRGVGLNDYLYILGRDPEQGRSTIQGAVTVVVEDPGPLVATLRVESDAPGCERLVRRVRLADGFDHVELVNTVDKLRERRPEGLYFDFPFDVPGARARVDVPWAVVQVERDQLQGANRNFFCVQRFVDLSNDDFGVTWVPIDAPMVQFDPIKIAGATGRQWWRTHIDPQSYVHSWTMNNHWETNYKADQEGVMSFAYRIQPHVGGYDAVAAQRFGREACQPLLAVTGAGGGPAVASLLEVTGEGVVVTSVRPSRDGRALMLRLFNTADGAREARVHAARPFSRTWISNPMEHEVREAPAAIELARHAIVTLRLVR